MSQDINNNTDNMKIEKLIELDYDELVSFKVIQKNLDLYETFFDEIPTPLDVIEKNLLNNELSEEIKTLIFDVFDNVILTSNKYIGDYLRILNSDGKPINVVKKTETPIIESVEEVKKVITKISDKLPRRYGKEKIIKDVAKQGGKMNNSQLTALALINFKNIYTKLERRVNKNMLTEEKILSDEDLREIRSAFKILENKTKHLI